LRPAHSYHSGTQHAPADGGSHGTGFGGERTLEQRTSTADVPVALGDHRASAEARRTQVPPPGDSAEAVCPPSLRGQSIHCHGPILYFS
jgi:hypothetical protein